MRNSKANQNTACNYYGQCWYYRDYEEWSMFDDTNPCTPINRAYPRHENIDFTAPELSFDGSAVKWTGLKLDACHWVPWASIGCLERNGLRPCDIE